MDIPFELASPGCHADERVPERVPSSGWPGFAPADRHLPASRETSAAVPRPVPRSGQGRRGTRAPAILCSKIVLAYGAAESNTFVFFESLSGEKNRPLNNHSQVSGNPV